MVLLQLIWQRAWKLRMWQQKQTLLLRQTRHQMMLRLMM
jgi:Fe-S cluster biosynthesis and repair protein YggX